MKPATRPPLRATRLLDQVRERIRYCHCSLRTEQAYVHWVRAFIRFHTLPHPRHLRRAEVEAYLAHLASARGVAAATHKQALCALLFLYREVLGRDLPWMANPHVLSSSAAGLTSPLDRLPPSDVPARKHAAFAA